MPIKALGPVGGSSNVGSGNIGPAPLGGASSNLNTAGKVNIDLTRPAESFGESAAGFAGGVQGLGKAAVSLIENIPIAGWLTKPAIGVVGAVADATVGKVVDAVSKSPIGDGLNNVAGKAVEIATLPIVKGLEALSVPSQIVQKKVAEARIRATAYNEKNLFSFVFGDAPKSAITQVRAGRDIEDIAEEYVSQFGTEGSAEKGAFSQDGLVNFLWVLALDPLNIIPVGKPFEIASKAAKLSISGVDNLRGAEKWLLSQAAKSVDPAESARLTAQAAGKADDALFLEKWDWAGKIYTATWGKVTNGFGRITGGRLSRELAQQPERIIGTKVANTLFDDIAETTSRQNVEEGLGNAVLTTVQANKAALNETLVAAQRNVKRESAQAFTRNLFEALTNGTRGADNLLEVEFGTNRTIKQFLGDLGIQGADAVKVVERIEKGFVPNTKAFWADQNITGVVGELTDIMQKIDVRSRPDFFIAAADALGKSNIRHAVDSGIELIQRNKLNLIRFTTNKEQFVNYLGRSIEFGFRVSADKAQEIAARQFDLYAGNPRDLLNALEAGRMASFGRAMREIAIERATETENLKLLENVALSRREAIARAYFSELPPEEALGVATLRDFQAQAAADLEGITVEAYYAKYTFGIDGLSVTDDAIAITDELFSTRSAVKAALQETNRADILRKVLEIKPSQRLLDAGLGSRLEPKIIETKKGPMVIPGGLEALADPAAYSPLDEIIISAQPYDLIDSVDGAVRVGIHKKMTASKSIDMQDPIAVVNRMIFSSLSPRRLLASNAAMYQALRLRDSADVDAFLAKYGDDIRGLPEAGEGGKNALGTRIADEFGFTDDDGTGIIGQLADAARMIALVSDNPKFFTLQSGETMLDFAERMTLINGVGLKVGVFGTELMDTAAMPIGAIDSQMSVEIMKWARGKGVAEKMIADLEGIGTKESLDYAKNMRRVLNEINGGNLKVKGPNASGTSALLGRDTIANAATSDLTKQYSKELPAYAVPKSTAEVALFKGSSFEVMIRYMDEMAQEWATVGRAVDGETIKYTGLETMSGAQRQWFIWDIARQQMEPHYWLHRDVDKLAKPTPEQIRKAVEAIKAAGGGSRVRKFEGVDPNIIMEFMDERGGEVLGRTQFTRNGKSAIQLFKGADIRTAIHEIGHIGRRQISPQDQRVVLEVYGGAKTGWTTELEERFANDFADYLYTGKAPNLALTDLFGKIRQWMSDLWSNVSKTEEINPELRNVFDRMLSHNGPKAIPDADTWSRVTLISERSLTQNARDAIIRRVNALLGEGDGSETLRSVPEATDDVMARIDGGLIQEDGGASFNPIRATEYEMNKSTSFTVSGYPQREVAIQGADRARFLVDKVYQKQVLAKFVEKNEDLLSLDSHIIGLYDDPDSLTYYIDVSKAYDSVQEAIEVGTRAGQQSVFGLTGGKTMYLDTPLGRLGAAKKGAKIIRSASDLSPESIAAMSKPRPSEASLEKMLRPLADELVAKYDDVAAVWWNKSASAIDIVDWVRNHPEITVRELTETEARLLPDGFRSRLPEIENGGYRFGVAPKGGIIERTTRVADGFGGTRITTSAQPFVDILDTVGVNAIDQKIAGIAKRRGFVDKFSDLMTRQYGPDVVRTNYIERFVTDITKKANIAPREAEIILAKIGNLAARKETTVRGLWFERDQVEAIFKEVLGDANYYKYIDKNNPLIDLFSAAQGDMSVVGLAPSVSGRAKAWKPIMGAITDRAFPLIRFGKGNPFFRQILEPIETKLMALVDGIKRDQVDEFLGGRPSTLIRRMTEDSRSVTNEIAESVFYDQEKGVVGTLSALNEAPEFTGAVTKVLNRYGAIKNGAWAINNPEEYKLMVRDIMASEYAVDKVFDLLQKAAPDTFKHLAESGLADGRQIMAMILEDGMIQSSPRAFATVLKREAGPTLGLWSRALAETGIPQSQAREIAGAAYGVFTDAMLRGTNRAQRYQFFSSQRTWFERSINHPFLGIYPYSYMTQKAIPWMLKVMFAPKINGTIRPGLGYMNMMRLKEFLAADANTDRSFMTTIAETRPLWYALNIMLPATPTSMGFAAPYWLRKGIIQPALQGKEINAGQLSEAVPLIGETVFKGTVIGQAGTLLAGAGAFGDSLEKDLFDVSGEINRFFNP